MRAPRESNTYESNPTLWFRSGLYFVCSIDARPMSYEVPMIKQHTWLWSFSVSSSEFLTVGSIRPCSMLMILWSHLEGSRHVHVVLKIKPDHDCSVWCVKVATSMLMICKGLKFIFLCCLNKCACWTSWSDDSPPTSVALIYRYEVWHTYSWILGAVCAKCSLHCVLGKERKVTFWGLYAADMLMNWRGTW